MTKYTAPTLKLLLGFGLFSLLLFSAGCKKDDTVYKACFYTNLPGEKGQLVFFLNDVRQGMLPFADRDVMDLPDSMLYKTLQMDLKAGTYTLKAFDTNNELKVSSKISFSSRHTSSSGNMGGNSMSVKGNTMVVNLFY
jgi:hypothetical protein